MSIESIQNTLLDFVYGLGFWIAVIIGTILMLSASTISIPMKIPVKVKRALTYTAIAFFVVLMIGVTFAIGNQIRTGIYK